MGDPGPSNRPELPSFFGNQRGHEFLGRVLPISGLQPSVPISSTDLHPQPPPYYQPLDHLSSSVSFRQDEHEEWSHRASELAPGPSSGHRGGAADFVLGGSSHAGETLDRMSRDDLFTYPDGEADAVTITQRDLEGLQPGRFLSDNIIDFYMKYLSLTILSRESGKRFHFFSSFFFTKVLESSTCMGFDQWKVDYQQLRKWIGEVNLFEKDYVFIPIIARSHWSLLVVFHLKSLDPSSLGEPKGPPCILHLDPIEGRHECFEGQVRSLILQAWMDNLRVIDNVDVLHALVQMKHIQAKVPQQDNDYDCGLYILHYIEVFLSKIASLDASLSSCERDTFFTKPNFKVEVGAKRNLIQCLTFKLGGMSQVYDENHLGLQPMPPQEDGFVQPKRCHQQGRRQRVKETKSKKWKELETLILLQCVCDGGCFNKGKQGAMDWDLIAEAINAKNIGGPMRSKEQCQNRFDTLLKAYKDLSAYCLKMGKEFCNVRKDEKRLLKLATPLKKKHEVWYNHLHTIYIHRLSLRGESHKRPRCNFDGDVDLSKVVPSPQHLSPKSLPTLGLVGGCTSVHSSPIQDVVEAFNGLGVALRYTFFNLLQVHFSELCLVRDDGAMSLEGACRVLAIVQDENPLNIRNCVYELQDLKLVTLLEMEVDEECFGDCWMDKRRLEISKVCKTFGRKVLSKNLHLTIVHKLLGHAMLATKLCLLQPIRVLILSKCQDLEVVDLGDFPNLCYLHIRRCVKLKEVNGWGSARRLGWIEIWNCPSFCILPCVEFPSSLKEFEFLGDVRQNIPWPLANFSQCIQLRILEIENDVHMKESMDLKGLRCLEVLLFLCCPSLFTIHGLRGLQALTKLKVRGCTSLKTIPELGCLKALTSLDMGLSGIVDIRGVQELHLLTSLTLCRCESLEPLPPLGHLKALTYLDISESNIEEILGVEDLVSLETLYCMGSQLKRLPNLNHLCRLHEIDISDTPLHIMDPSRSFIGGYELIHCDREKEGLFVDDISDLSDIDDFEDTSFDEN